MHAIWLSMDDHFSPFSGVASRYSLTRMNGSYATIVDHKITVEVCKTTVVSVMPLDFSLVVINHDHRYLIFIVDLLFMTQVW